MLKIVTAVAIVSVVCAQPVSTAALGGPLGYAPSDQPHPIFDPVLRDRRATSTEQEAVDVPAHLRRQLVAYQTHEAAGTIVIDTPNTQLYFVLGGGKAIRYGIGVGREGFTWSGVQTISRKTEWPDWIPPAEMLQRQPYLPRFMAGGPGNPLGARAMYLGGTIYRIHGTNAPETIGGQVSSGCIRMLNEDVADLYARVGVGTRVVVLPAVPRIANEFATRSRPVSEAKPVMAAGNSVRPFGLY
jgi:lipoprotein-anchoring transpeptidase ErfK/SrfK